MCKFYKTKKGEYPNKKESLSKGWSVTQEESEYYLEYISGALIGKLKKIKINEEDYHLAKNGKLNLDQLCAKYNVF